MTAPSAKFLLGAANGTPAATATWWDARRLGDVGYLRSTASSVQVADDILYVRIWTPGNGVRVVEKK